MKLIVCLAVFSLVAASPKLNTIHKKILRDLIDGFLTSSRLQQTDMNNRTLNLNDYVDVALPAINLLGKSLGYDQWKLDDIYANLSYGDVVVVKATEGVLRGLTDGIRSGFANALVDKDEEGLVDIEIPIVFPEVSLKYTTFANYTGLLNALAFFEWTIPDATLKMTIEVDTDFKKLYLDKFEVDMNNMRANSHLWDYNNLPESVKELIRDYLWAQSDSILFHKLKINVKEALQNLFDEINDLFDG